jgi:23S rRNA (adenine2503-C2)-methyltransferase
MDLALLDDRLAALGEPRFRAGQVWEWTARGALGYGEMTNLPAGLRETLAEEVPFSTLELEREAHARDGTVKALFRTHDGRPSRPSSCDTATAGARCACPLSPAAR